MAGSWGTLGFLHRGDLQGAAEAGTHRRRWCSRGLDDRRGDRGAVRGPRLALRVTGAAHLPAATRRGAETLIRLEGFSDSLDYRVGELQQLLDALRRPSTSSTPPRRRRLWRRCAMRRFSPSQRDRADLAGLGARRRAGPVVAAQIAQRLDARWFYDWGGGLVWIATAASRRCRRCASSAMRSARRVRPRDARARARPICARRSMCSSRSAARLMMLHQGARRQLRSGRNSSIPAGCTAELETCSCAPQTG